MPISATIEVVAIASLKTSPVVPTDRLKLYFQALGVDLTFQQGQPVDKDPSRDSAALVDFCAKWAPAPDRTDRPGILLLADTAPEGDAVNGQLLDPLRRGVCTVFTNAAVFTDSGDDERFEIYVHELGHMLNLAHRQADETFATAMTQWDGRSRIENRKQLWEDTISHGNSGYRSTLNHFFGSVTGSPVGLPMSRTCCDFLVDALRTDVLPWGGKFNDGSAGGRDDRAYGKVDCTLELEADRLEVGQPLAFAVSVRLRKGERASDIPVVIDVRSGNVDIELEGPNGIRKLLPEAHSCTSMRRRLQARQVARRNFSMFGDAGGVALPKPGDYRVRAVLPTLGVESSWSAVSVHATKSPLRESSFQEFLARGLPRGDDRHWRALDQLIHGNELPAATRAHIGVIAAAKHLRDLPSQRAVQAIASPRVAERDALLRIEHWRSQGPEREAQLHAAIDAAEKLFTRCDLQHSTLSYLRHLRQHEYTRR